MNDSYCPEDVMPALCWSHLLIISMALACVDKPVSPGDQDAARSDAPEVADAGEVLPDVDSDVEPIARNEPSDADSVTLKAGCDNDDECFGPTRCVKGECVCPIGGCRIDECEGHQVDRVGQDRKACKNNKGIDICIGLDKSQYTTSEDILLTTVIKNNTKKSRSHQFSCTATAPGLVVNSQKQNNRMICGQAVTFVTIEPGEQVTYCQKTAAIRWGLGELSIAADWQEMKSGEVVIEVTKAPEPEIKKAEEACLAGINSNHCESLIITINKNHTGRVRNCADMDNFFSSLNITHDVTTSSICKIGIGAYFVPRSNSDFYVNEFKKFDFVKSATISPFNTSTRSANPVYSKQD